MDNMSTDEKFDMILQMVKELSGNVNVLGNNVDQLSSKVDQLNSNVDQLSNDVKEIKEDQKQMNERLGKVEVGMRIFNKELNENKVETERIKQHVGLEF